MEKSEALEKSIKKWQDIVDEKEVDKGTLNCALCEKYRVKGSCSSCPVSEKSERSECRKTPYEFWIVHQKFKHSYRWSPYKVQCPECKLLAQEELDFLISLRED